MQLFRTLINSLAKKGRKFLQLAGVPLDLESNEHDVLVPICHLRAYNLADIQKHLLSLNPQDRYLRFGYAANDGHITNYVRSLNFERDDIYGIFNRDLQILAMAHLAIHTQLNPDATKQVSAEFGVSVHASARGRGYGYQLFKRALMHARNANASTILIHALSENAPMLKIARKAGATLDRDGSETKALLKVPKGNLRTKMAEIFTDQYAQTNYSIKEDVKNFWYFLKQVQEIRRGVQAGRHQSAE
jgi:RimJ/RimL family protein N-acetyltransferase